MRLNDSEGPRSNVIFHITSNSCQLIVQLDIDISIRFKVSFFTVYQFNNYKNDYLFRILRFFT